MARYKDIWKVVKGKGRNQNPHFLVAC